METRINRQIRASSVLLIDENGQNLGKLNIKDALRKAQDAGLDLVEVGGNNNVCRIMDYGKYKYEKSKKQKQNKQQKHQTKEIRFRPNTDKNDLNYRAKHVREFLANGHKVKLVVKFRGREMAHRYETGRALLERFMVLLEDVDLRIDGEVKAEGNAIYLFLSPPK